MKQLYWVDDNIQTVFHICHGAISKIWKLDDINVEGIESRIVIFGNGCEGADTDELPTEADEKKAYNKIFDFFLERCMATDGPNKNRPMFKAKKDLIQNPVTFLFKKSAVQDVDAYKRLKDAWISDKLMDVEGDEYKNAAKEAESLIDRMQLLTNCVVGIDVFLLYGDEERLYNQKRIISMELYHKISRKNIQCFMYSSEADNDILRERLENVYKELYDEPITKIYQRSDFMQKGNANIVKEVEEMFDNVKEG